MKPVKTKINEKGNTFKSLPKCLSIHDQSLHTLVSITKWWMAGMKKEERKEGRKERERERERTVK